MPSADFDKSSISKGAYTIRVTNGCSRVCVVVDISNGAYLFVAREVGRSNVEHLGHEIQVSRLGRFGSRKPRSGNISNVVAAPTTQANDARDDGAPGRFALR